MNVIDSQKKYNVKKESKYRQFKQVAPKGLITIKCPTCKETFGLNTQHVEAIGEVGYLHPYICPYCAGTYTLKDE